jgi:hypothetical protein
MRPLIICILLLGAMQSGAAQTEPDWNEPVSFSVQRDDETPEFQGENITVRRFDEVQWENTVGTTDYTEKRREPKKESRSQSFNSADTGTRAPFVGNLSYLFVAALVILFLYLIIRNIDLKTQFVRKRIQLDQPSEDRLENIEELEVDKLLRIAREQKDYRMVVRLYFLGLLQQLNEKGLIRWEKDKTNREYLSELFARETLYNDVRPLTLAYEEVWYGEHPVTDQFCEVIVRSFEQLNQKLKTVAP